MTEVVKVTLVIRKRYSRWVWDVQFEDASGRRWCWPPDDYISACCQPHALGEGLSNLRSLGVPV